MKDKKVICLVAVIVILVIALAGSIGYNIYKSNSYNTEKNEKNTNKKELKEVEVDKDKMVSLIAAYNSVFSESYPITDVNKLSNQDKLTFLYKNLEKDEWYGFTGKDLEEVAKKHFNSEFTFTNEDIKCQHGTIFTYDASTDKYNKTNLYGHGEGGYLSKTYFVDSKYNEEDDVYLIGVKTLYYYCDDICFPVDIYGSANTNDVIYTRKEDDYDDILDKAYIEAGDKVNKVVYTFTKKDDNYLLKSVK